MKVHQMEVFEVVLYYVNPSGMWAKHENSAIQSQLVKVANEPRQPIR